MPAAYQARRISKERARALRRSGALGQAILLDSVSGFIIVEPVGSNLGDGEVLAREIADSELHSAWCLDPLSRIRQARQLLGLEAIPEGQPTVAGHNAGAP
ncbi:MAG TPA: hypothetical protein VNK04_12360 [Gemmataceae bacterium]|nr:hypothetical protein [Gemmataceae bacterium]